MFGWFGNKNRVKEAKVFSHVGTSRKMAFTALAEKLKDEKGVQVFFFFQESREAFEKIIADPKTKENINFHDGGKYNGQVLAGKEAYFCLEFPPLYSSFQRLLQQLGQSGSVLHVYTGLDEPLFDQFGGERILSLMKTLGMKEDELIEHAMVTQSIERAQKKLEEKQTITIHAQSSKEWFTKFNLQQNNS